MKELYFALMSINLQLFANTPNTNVTTDSGLSVENKTYYDMTLIDEAQANLVHDQFAQKRNIPKNGGKKIEFRKFASLPKALTPLTEGVTPDGKKLSVTKIEAEVSQYGDYIVQSDVLELTSIDNTIVEATKILGRQAGLTLDTITRNVMQGGTNVYYCPKANGTAVTSRADLDATCKLTVDVVNRVVALLKKNNAPKINGDYVAIIHPLVAYDLMSDERWIDAHKYAQPENIYNGELGKIGGVRFVESSEAKVYDGGVFGCLFLADGAYGTTEITGGGLETIIKQKGSAGTADPLDQRSSIGWKAMKTAERLVEPYMVRVECKSALSDKAETN
jgi:N4-gp56 family major capsid protein